MTHPAAPATGVVPAYGGYGPNQAPSQPAPAQSQLPPAPSPKRSRGKGLWVAVIAATALISAGIGGGIVAAVNHVVSQSPAAPAAAAPTAEQVHADNVRLCTSFAIYNSAMPNAPEKAAELMPQVYGLRLALADSPNASPEIRDAITAVANSYDAAIADIGKVRTRGYAQPPTYSTDQARVIYEHAWDVCQLGN